MNKNSNNRGIICVYCGQHILYDPKKDGDMAAARVIMIDHDQSCEKNPLVQKIKKLEKQVLDFEEIEYLKTMVGNNFTCFEEREFANKIFNKLKNV